ncbi:MAG: hypothetical protein N2C14_04435, partial [Planctomycetales bacterium]
RLTTLADEGKEAERISWAIEVLREAGIGRDAPQLLRYLQSSRTSLDLRGEIDAWVKSLGSDLFSRREQASKRLLLFGIRAEPALRKALGSSDREVVRRARGLLRRIAAEHDPGAEEERFNAALVVLGAKGDAKAVGVLLRLLPGVEQPYLAAVLQETLWKSVGPENEQELRTALASGDPVAQAAAAVGLEIAVGKNSVDTLEKLLTHESAVVRLAAARALANHLPKPSLAALIGLTDSRDAALREQSVRLLRLLTGKRFVDEDDGEFRVAGAWKEWAEKHGATAKPRVIPDAPRLRVAFSETFQEHFGKSTEIEKKYGRFQYSSDLPAKAKVEDGILRLNGEHPECDQRLTLSAVAAFQTRLFPRKFHVKAKIGGEANGSGGYHVGVSLGNVRILFHPAYSGGGFRAERVDNQEYLCSNQTMNFTPTGGVLHEMAIEVEQSADSVTFHATVTDGAEKANKYRKTLVIPKDVVGALDRIGLERSGRTGGAALFDSLVIRAKR